MKSFYSILLGIKNVNLIKPEGMIPFELQKFGYDSYITCYDENEKYDYLNKELKGLKIKYINSKYKSDLLNLFSFFKKQSKNINVLMVFHLDFYSIFEIIFFKCFNKKGILYLRFDADERATNIITHNMSYFKSINEKFRFFFDSYIYIFLHKHFIDMSSVDTKIVYDKICDFNRIYQEKLFLSPNGINVKDVKDFKKVNQILTVGRLGTYQKATEILLQSFKNLKNRKDWVLKLVGPIDKNFEDYIQKFFNENPELKRCVKFLGNVQDRKKLSELYAESKIFCLPSRYESYAIVLGEAAYFGDYVISTDVGVASELLEITNYGSLIEVDNINNLSDILQNFIDNENKIYKNPLDLKELVSSKLDYNVIASDINDKIESCLNE